MTLRRLKAILRKTYKEQGVEFTPLEKFEVMAAVLSNLRAAGDITEDQYNKWVNVY